MTIDLTALWDFGNPEVSEKRFQAALERADANDALILQTQIARTYGLRRDFDRAQEILHSIEPQLADASPEARTHHMLEWGRTLSSATHSPESQTDEVKEAARAAYRQAVQLAQEAQLDALAIDALHMLAFVDTEPAHQLKWGREALKISTASTQPAARRWEASLRNNIGYALHQLERYDEAMEEFQIALNLREESGNAESIRVAHWMIAWTLRAMGQIGEALAIQLRLEQENKAAGTPDGYVFEELAHLYNALGDADRAEEYVAKNEALR